MDSCHQDLVLIILSKKNIEDGFETAPSAKVGIEVESLMSP